MDFAVDEELKMIQSMVRDFVTDQLKPWERDIMGRAADLSDARFSLPPETEQGLIQMVQQMGLWGAGIPEELGGVGLSILGTCLVEEELAQTVIPFNLGDVTPILFDCNDRQMEDYFLPALYRQKQPYLALMEPEKGEDIATIGMKAEPVNGDYILNGEKVSFSRTGDSYFAVVFAVTTVGSTARDGVTCFLVDRGTPGFTVTDGQRQSGWQAQQREPVLLSFENCRVTADSILGEKNRAFDLGKEWLPARRIVRGARCLGVAQRLLEEATRQAQSWQSFGQFIFRRADIQSALSDIAINIHASRLMVHEAAWMADRGESIRHRAAMVKLHTTQMLYNVADRVAHVYGGPPTIAGLPVPRLCRHALATSTTELALELQRKILATDILKGIKV